jgi:SRSO17 transposase
MFVHGVLSGLARKNGWTLATYAGDSRPDGMQRLLNGARWDADGVRDDLRDWVLEHLGDQTAGVLVLDEIGFMKKGRHSAGVDRQYVAGRFENVQVAVFMAYVAPRGRALVDRELYLPQPWTVDMDRRRRAGVPDDVTFASKPQLALRMIERALRADAVAPWLVAGDAFGESQTFRTWLDNHRVAHVLEIRGHERITTRHGPAGEARDLAATLTESAWERVSHTDPATEARFEDWARIALAGVESAQDGRTWERSLLIRRSPSRPARLAFYRGHAPAGTGLPELVRVASAHGAVRECIEQAKTDLGLDQYQVRRYEAWYRHVTLCMLAGAYLAVTRQRG